MKPTIWEIMLFILLMTSASIVIFAMGMTSREKSQLHEERMLKVRLACDGGV